MPQPNFFRFVVITSAGVVLLNEPKTYQLQPTLRAACDRLKLRRLISYDRAWRGIRHEGAYAEVVPVDGLPGQATGAVGVIIFSLATGYEQPLIPRPSSRPAPADA